ncbi:hypothetical protein GPA10_39265 [Streptomyces sp. p1417]|uniref:Uncharacterized protein n=1 Tax=Streptomyces typhae TaxID=2681492 RepID=A0A6L6X9K9_9ACTN|nr:hypothetical protein [Streptomyces typhae]MVO90633.1 hypothetical protein [Streptomyces typhae]
MFTLVLLLFLVGLMMFGALFYVSHRRPVFSQPLLVATGGTMMLIAAVAVIVTATAATAGSPSRGGVVPPGVSSGK